jgi:hypothetical protein
MLLRIRDFATVHRDRIPETSDGRQAFAAVAQAVAEIEARATDKLVNMSQWQRERGHRRAIILERLRIIARTSRGVRTSSGVSLNLRMPRRRSDLALVTAARGFLRETRAYTDQFVQLGLPAACLTELRDAADGVAEALAGQRAGRPRVVAAQVGITAAIARGTDAARTLDIVVTNALGNDPVAFASWRRDRRVVEGKRRRVTRAS